MAFIEWSMEGVEAANCNCAPGCPCQFNQLPTHGDCRAYTFVRVNRGRFGDTPLDGLCWGIVAAWPKAIHQGNGTFQVIIDERANQQQRDAVEAVAQGRETDPGSLVWQVFSATVTNLLPTVIAPIEFECDPDARTARLRVPGIVEATVAPIRNPNTGAAHRVRINLPNGFEFTTAEVAAGTAKTQGAVTLDFTNTHAHLARIHWSTHGVVR
jgi:hypothetical protein